MAPAPFLAVDRDGFVSYANAAAAELFGRPLEEVVGRALPDAWPEAGAALGALLAAPVNGAPVERTLTTPRSRRTIEVRGFPGEEGAAVFLRET